MFPMKSSSLLLLLILAMAAASAAAAALLGGWSPISDPNDAHVVEIGKFAVAEHNRKASTSVAFRRVLSGSTQVVAGANYKLLILGADKGVRHTYEAVVWEKSWENFRQLTSFTLKN